VRPSLKKQNKNTSARWWLTTIIPVFRRWGLGESQF
jgi:hypothetical protein